MKIVTLQGSITKPLEIKEDTLLKYSGKILVIDSLVTITGASLVLLNAKNIVITPRGKIESTGIAKTKVVLVTSGSAINMGKIQVSDLILQNNKDFINVGGMKMENGCVVSAGNVFMGGLTLRCIALLKKTELISPETEIEFLETYLQSLKQKVNSSSSKDKEEKTEEEEKSDHQHNTP